MSTEGTVLEPLLLPDDQGVTADEKCHITSAASDFVTCILCDEMFDIKESEANLLKHFLVEHRLVIADVRFISNLKR